MKLKLFTISPVVRISLSLIAIVITWLFFLDLTVGILPDETANLQKIRMAKVEAVATKVSYLLQVRDFAGIQSFFNQQVKKEPEFKSLGIRLKNGRFIAASDNHRAIYQPVSKPSAYDYLSLELNADGKVWANFEVAFVPIQPANFFDWLMKPTILMMIVSVLVMLVFFSVYLKKIFRYLDPSAVIPDRIRAAFDAFSEGVLMIDRSGFVVLMNKTVQDWLGDATPFFGKHVSQLPWLSKMQLRPNEKYPWTEAMDLQQAIQGVRLDFQDFAGNVVYSVFNCSPVVDASGVSRGCLISIDNITQTEKLNQELSMTNQALIKSREALDRQNDELKKLATRDPLTNCLNRRSFYELGEHLMIQAKINHNQIACVMFDIDFFKKINDTYGHGVGDKAIISVAKTAFGSLRQEDLLCRYGGEEFVILLPNATLETAIILANRIRLEIEAKAGVGLLDNEGSISVTASFGVSVNHAKIQSLSQFIESSDLALYQAKQNGRNRVEIAAQPELALNE